MKIAHLSDIHIRFASRHEEYREVFKRLYDDLKKQKPERIVITGDVNHLKVNMSPGSLGLTAEFLINLAKISPVDIIFGNHDLNLQQKEQGDTITPIFNVADKFSELMPESSKKALKRAFIINKDNAESVDFSKKGIYLFPDSDFYKISDKLVYGIYSCKDNKILALTKKDPGIKYVALFHGQIKGARGDNGYELFGDNLLNIQTFSNFDVVMLGDLHEHQSFRDDESCAYASSLIQQDYGESVDKGYLMWDLNSNSFQRRYILNDYGFAKITISKGEVLEDRIENIKFSNDKKKTKVYVVWEDYEENYSTEKELQITKLIKEKFGCEVVKVEFSQIEKLQKDNTDAADSKNKETFLQQVADYIKETNPSEEEDVVKEVLKLAELVDKELEISDKVEAVKLWDVDCIEISNIFSFPEKPTIIRLEDLRGSTGIFGRNYSGKSNVVKAIVWGLYQHILGGGAAQKIVNIYTSSNKGYVKIHLAIDGEKYYIKRSVETTVKKSGESSNSYPIEYKKLILDDDGNETWASEISDKKANDKKEIKEIISLAIGTVDDFTKVCLQAQGGKEDYINQDQQPKNDLVNKYLGLETFRDRYEYGNKTFNDVKKKQKELGDIVSLQSIVSELEIKILALKGEYGILVNEKIKSEEEKEKLEKMLIALSKKLKQYVELTDGDISDKNKILNHIKLIEEQTKIDEVEYQSLLKWVSANFKKELPFDESENLSSLTIELEKENGSFSKNKEKYIEIEGWMKLNPIKPLNDISGFDVLVSGLNIEISNLQNKLPTYKGEQCPTCGHVTMYPDEEMHERCTHEIQSKTLTMKSYSDAIKKYSEDVEHNNKYQIQSANLQSLRSSLTASKERKSSLSEKITIISQSQNTIEHNKNVELKNKRLQDVKISIDKNGILIQNLRKNLDKLKQNEEVKSHNASTENTISVTQEQIKSFKFSIYDLSQQITNKNGDIRVEENNLENYKIKLIEVKNAEKLYKKYSIYLQAVHRDGIPAKIIRRKLPIINNKINSILGTIVNFKINMSVNKKGDIIEDFYYSPDKSDMLPLAFASGAQKFISSVVIKDSLHYMSNLIKPSLNIIDEGFGTLDDELISGIITVLQYLKNKYKNVLIITHRNEIKDSVNNIIEVYKTYENIPQEIIDINEHAGITKLNIS